MAIVNGKSGTFNIYTQNQYINGYVKWQETYDDSTYISTNKSTVTIKAYLHRTNIYSDPTYVNGIAGQRIAYFGSEQVVDNSALNLSIAGNTSSSGGAYTKVFEASKEITHDSNGAKSLEVGFYMSNVASGSGANAFKVSKTTAPATLTTIPRYATSNQSLKDRTETSITMNWSSDNTIDYVWYSTDWGTTWKEVGSVNAKSGSYTINYPSNSTNKLSANTSYNVITRVRRKDSQLTTNSAKLSVTTYDYPHCTNSPNFTIGNTLTLTIYNPLSRSVTIKGYAKSDGSKIFEGTTSGTSASGFKDEYSVNLQYASIKNAKSGAYKVEVIYGSITKTRDNGNTYSIKGTETPTVGTITYEDSNTSVTKITGNNQHIVQNKSNLKIKYTSATAKNSATISKYTFTLNGVTKESTSAGGTIDFGVINSSNDLTLTMVVTDSRGLTSSATKTITILAHSNPNAIVTLKRLNNYEDETYLTVDGSISSVNGKNAMTIQYRYKVSGGSYGSFVTISDNVKNTLSFDKNNSYIFNIVVTDSFGAKYDKEHTLGKGVFPLFIDTVKNSVGINALPRTNNVLEVAGRIIESEKEFSVPVSIGATTGWYLAMSGSFSYVTNKVFLIAIQQVFSGGAGLLYLNMRNDDNGLKTQRFEWLSQNGISSSNVKLKIEGSSFYLYLKTTANYQQYYLKVLQEKELGGWGFQQYKMYSPNANDKVEEPSGQNPTDFIQTTSTNNGTVIKYPDGTMIINQKYSTTVQTSNWAAWGSMYSAKLNIPPNFPVAFVGNKPTVTQTLETDSANASLCTCSENTSISSLTRAAASQVMRPTNPGSNAVFTVHITAIGRWK